MLDLVICIFYHEKFVKNIKLIEYCDIGCIVTLIGGKGNYIGLQSVALPSQGESARPGDRPVGGCGFAHDWDPIIIIKQMIGSLRRGATPPCNDDASRAFRYSRRMLYMA